MPDSLDLQSDRFMTLLTDALRSGPGSPEWNQAVKTLRASDQNIDEYTLLYAARERLESGKEFRSVRAGAGFTRKVIEGIDEQTKTPGVPTANIIALIAAGVILVIVAVVGVMLLKGTSTEQHAIEELNRTIFGNKFLSASFGGPELPDGWNRFGELPVTAKGNELRPSTLPAGANTDRYIAGGLVTAAPVPADRPLEIDVVLKAAKPGDEGIAQVFISDEPITEQNAAGGHALVWQFKAGEARAFLADGTAAGQAEKFTAPRELAIKIAINRDTAIIETSGKSLYAGPHRLSPDKPRYAGVRFLRRGGEKWDHLGIASITLQKP